MCPESDEGFFACCALIRHQCARGRNGRGGWHWRLILLWPVSAPGWPSSPSSRWLWLTGPTSSSSAGSSIRNGTCRKCRTCYLATIEALALAIDAKDEIGQRHVRRAQVYAAALGKALGMSDTEIQGVKTASLLHDIGKLCVHRNTSSSKPGPLTQEEFQKIRVHPQIGAEIIGGVPFPYPVAPLILCHHERWDGKGYPAGLAGDEIPTWRPDPGGSSTISTH